MEAKDQELKAFAISHLMAGDSYRQVQTAVRDTYGQTVALSTLSAWANEDSETAGAISRAHLTTVANQRVRYRRQGRRHARRSHRQRHYPARTTRHHLRHRL